MINEVSRILFTSVMVTTLLSCSGYMLFFITQHKNVREIARGILLLSGVLQTLYILSRYLLAGYTPVTSHHEAVFFFSWSTTWAYLSFRLRYKVKNFGTFVSILVFILLCISASSSKDVLALQPILQSRWLPVHAGAALFSYGFLSLAFIGGLMYLLQERELKTKNFGYLFARFPSLDALDQLNSHCLSIGFGFLTLGMVTGVIWTKQALGMYWRWDPKEIWTVITWFFYLIQIHQRFRVGWRGKRAAVMSIIGFVAILFTFWGVTYLMGGEHSYGN